MLSPRPAPGARVERGTSVLLAVDVGNTEIVLGVFRGASLEHHWRMSTMPERTSDELALLLSGFLAQRDMSFESMISGVVIASVVPAVTEALREMSARYFPFPPVVVGPGTKTGVPVLTDNPREVGADRIVNALAAFDRFGGPAIVVDFGTGTNFDVVSASGEFVGGVIAPGLQVSAASLVHRTARLTRVELTAPRSVVGKNTAGEFDGIVERIRADLGGSPVVIATGGLAAVVVPHCRTIDHHEPWLTLEGLRLVFEKNVVTADG
jgi:type III pantothenate kinase